MDAKFYQEHGLRISDSTQFLTTEEPENLKSQGSKIFIGTADPEFVRRLLACWNAMWAKPIEEIEELASHSERARSIIHCPAHNGNTGSSQIVPDCPGCKASALSSGVTAEQWQAFRDRHTKGKS